mmetsp:Transcript_1731/g.4887  ORF Transcript_1731/g.4887 Transcript_1731/m.4887 type:complete len:233 (-) Transcript_1731:180-878(-)
MASRTCPCSSATSSAAALPAAACSASCTTRHPGAVNERPRTEPFRAASARARASPPSSRAWVTWAQKAASDSRSASDMSGSRRASGRSSREACSEDETVVFGMVPVLVRSARCSAFLSATAAAAPVAVDIRAALLRRSRRSVLRLARESASAPWSEVPELIWTMWLECEDSASEWFQRVEPASLAASACCHVMGIPCTSAGMTGYIMGIPCTSPCHIWGAKSFVWSQPQPTG